MVSEDLIGSCEIRTLQCNISAQINSGIVNNVVVSLVVSRFQSQHPSGINGFTSLRVIIVGCLKTRSGQLASDTCQSGKVGLAATRATSVFLQTEKGAQHGGEFCRVADTRGPDYSLLVLIGRPVQMLTPLVNSDFAASLREVRGNLSTLQHHSFVTRGQIFPLGVRHLNTFEDLGLKPCLQRGLFAPLQLTLVQTSCADNPGCATRPKKHSAPWWKSRVTHASALGLHYGVGIGCLFAYLH